MDNKNNILKAISSYNSTNVESAILTLKKELQQQVLINTTLKDKDLKKKAKEITDFVARNEGQIDDQIKRLNDVVNNLKKVVSEKYKSLGVGKKLMGVLCAHAKNQDIISMWAGVSALNIPAIKFHEGLDFKIVARLPEVGYKLGTLVDLVLMRKLL